MLKKFIIGVIVFLIPGVMVFAGVEWQSKSVTKAENKESSLTLKGDAQSGNVREEVTDTTGTKNPLFKKGDYFIYQAGSPKVLLVNPAEKEYSEFSIEEMLGSLNQIMEIKISNAKVGVKQLANEDLSGYPCQHIQVESSYDMEMKIAFITAKSHIDSTQDYWGTAALGKDLSAAYQSKAFLTSIPDLDKLIKKQTAAVKNLGFIIKSVTVQKTSDLNKPAEVKTNTTEMIAENIVVKDIGKETFTVPADYKKTETKKAEETADTGKTTASAKAEESASSSSKADIKAEELIKNFFK